MTHSHSNQPDLDWSQVRETVRLITASVTQVESGMESGDESVNALTESFTSIVDHMSAIHDLLDELEPSEKKDQALEHCNLTSGKIQDSIIAFQFYDRLSQTLSHVAAALTDLSALVESPDRIYNPSEWKKLQLGIRSRFTMESEKVMFDAILEGKSMEEAVKLAAQAGDTEDDDIELF